MIRLFGSVALPSYNEAVSFDFSQLGQGHGADTLIDPRDIFDALPNKQHSYLRDVQTEVLEGWFERHTDKDVVIKMNTGGGKTLVGLLVLKSCLNEGVGPAVYITPDKYLTQQVLAEAEALGVEAVDDPQSARFTRGKAVLVANVMKLINGRSTFGVGDARVKIPIGSLLLDDAHACLATAEEQFTLRLPQTHEAYKLVFSLFEEAIDRQNPSAVLDLKDADPYRTVLVPFYAWQEKIAEVRAIFHRARQDEDLKFTWPLLSEDLQFAHCTFGPNGLEVATRCLPIDRLPSFSGAKRRIFMTATLPDDSVLVTDFAVGKVSVEQPVTPKRASDLGERMILVPQELNANRDEVNDDEMKAMLVKLAETYNVVVIVPSNHRAGYWRDAAALVLTNRNLEEGVKRLKAGHVGLVVLVNKYDGVDLPGDACRVLVIDGLPQVQRQFEAVDAGVLADTLATRDRQIQRIEQGMGRGVRSREDHCVVFLMGRSLVQQLYARGAKEQFTPATRAQLGLAEVFESRLRNQGLGPVLDAANGALERDPEWQKQSRAALAGVKYDPAGRVDPVALLQRQAFDTARASDPQGAARLIEQAKNGASDPFERGWLTQQLAEYVNHYDQVEAQQLLRSGLRDNPRITRPIEGITIPRLQTFQESQAKRCLDRLRSRYTDANKAILEVNGLVDTLAFKPKSSEAFEAALKEVGLLLGFDAQRPEQDTGRGPDVLWSVGSGQFFVIECKNEATANEVSKGYANQLSGSMHWFEGEHGAPGANARPVLIHPSEIFDYHASPHPGTRVMTQDHLPRFTAAVRAFFVALTTIGFSNTTKTSELLVSHSLTPQLILDRYTIGAKIA